MNDVSSNSYFDRIEAHTKFSFQLPLPPGLQYSRLAHYPILPPPGVGKPVGLGCPACLAGSQVSMKHISTREDAYIVGCSVHMNHHTRHWKCCHKLFFEISEINKGASRPVSYDEESLVRVAPDGTLLENQQPHKKRRRANTITCAYEGNPLRSQGHKKLGNKNCENKACQSCCRDLGPQQCPHHGQPGNPAQSIANSNNSRILAEAHINNLSQAGKSSTTDVSCAPSGSFQTQVASSGKHKTIDVPCAQSGSLPVGRPLSVAGLAAIDSSMKNRGGKGWHEYFLEHQKVFFSEPITIYCWVNSDMPPAYTAPATTWPIFRLDQHPTFVEDIGESTKGKWNRQVMVWDATAEVANWREMFVDYPHRYPMKPPIIICRLKKVDPNECEGLYDMVVMVLSQNKSGSQRPTLDKVDLQASKERFIDLTTDEDIDYEDEIEIIRSRVSVEKDSEAGKSHASEDNISLKNSSPLEEMTFQMLKNPMGADAIRGSKTHDTVLSKKVKEEVIKVMPSKTMDIEPNSMSPLNTATEVPETIESAVERETTPVITGATSPLLQWPTRQTPLSDLLGWYDDLIQSTNVVDSWRNHFGHMFDTADTNIHGYGRFLKIIYDKLKEWEAQNPGCLLCAARTHFHAYWLQARHLTSRKRKYDSTL